MSDLAPDVAVDAPVDEEFAALIARLAPFFLESAKAAVTEAVAAVPTPVLKPATVQGVSSTERTATVLIDGDATAIVAQVLTELPGLADRVMVMFVPPSAVFVTGLITAAGVPAGSIQAYAGPVTAHAGATQTSATSGQPPRGWLWCAGQAVSRSTYSALFNAIGTTYGTGDGATTFNVPDFRGRLPVGMDNMGGSDAGLLSSANTLGTTGGAETHSTVIAHTHSTPSHSHAAGTLAVASHTHDLASHTHSGTTSSDGAHTHTEDGYDGSSAAAAGAAFVAGLVGKTTGSDGAHTHTMTTGSPSNNTSGGAAPGLSGSTASDGSGTSGSTGTGSTVNHMPPFITMHYLVKT